MVVSIQEQILQLSTLVEYAEELYHRLVLVVGPSSSGKTRLLHRFAQRRATLPLFNINLELSRQLLELSDQERSLKGTRILQEIVLTKDSSVTLLDNTELLFQRQYQWNPLSMLQSCAHGQTVVATWNGRIQNGYLVYAEPSHPDYRREPIRDLLTLSLET